MASFNGCPFLFQMNECFYIYQEGPVGARGKRPKAFSKRLWETPAAQLLTSSQQFHKPTLAFASGVFHNRGSVHRPSPLAQIRSPETTGEPKKYGLNIFGIENTH